MCSIRDCSPARQPPGAGLGITHVDQLDAGIAAGKVQRVALAAVAGAPERQPQRLQLSDVGGQVGNHDAHVIDAREIHTATLEPVSSARSHASATASVRMASAGGQNMRV